VSGLLRQGRPAQPDPINELPITLTLRSGPEGITFANLTTDASGFFTVTADLSAGEYSWWAKAPVRWLANAGALTLIRGVESQVEIGLMRTGDANGDNAVNLPDFGILRQTLGKHIGDPGYDDRGDFTGDGTVNITDYALFKANFGNGGANPPGSSIYNTKAPVRGVRPPGGKSGYLAPPGVDVYDTWRVQG